MAACAKHFPGHGDTAPTRTSALPGRRATLRRCCARASWCRSRPRSRPGAPAVMTAHVLVPALDPTGPATLSARRSWRPAARTSSASPARCVTDALDMAGRRRRGARHPDGGGARSGAPAPTCSASARGSRRPWSTPPTAPSSPRCAPVPSPRSASRRPPPARRRSAAGPARRPRRTSRPSGSPPRRWGLSAPTASSGLGLAAARRALRVEGPPPAGVRGALVVELRPTLNIAAGPADHCLGDALRERDVSVTVLALGEADASRPGARPSRRRGRPRRGAPRLAAPGPGRAPERPGRRRGGRAGLAGPGGA